LTGKASMSFRASVTGGENPHKDGEKAEMTKFS
jgi:hypothetical protein